MNQDIPSNLARLMVTATPGTSPTTGEKMMIFRCQYHGYAVTATMAPPMHDGCEDCWLIYFLALVDACPPAQRSEMIERLMRVGANVEQEMREGKWDFHMYPKSKIVLTDDDGSTRTIH